MSYFRNLPVINYDIKGTKPYYFTSARNIMIRQKIRDAIKNSVVTLYPYRIVDGDRPDIVEAAKVVLDAGARGITVHPRPDQRHICPKDVCALSAVVSERPAIEFNIEGNPFAGPRDNGFPGFDCLIKHGIQTFIVIHFQLLINFQPLFSCT